MKIPYNILIQIKMSVRPYFKGFTLIFFFYNCRKQDCTPCHKRCQPFFLQLFFKTGSPVSFSVKIPYNIVDNKGGGAHAQ